MTKYFIGAVGSLLGIVAGAWLILAPTALAYQPDGADWVNATYTDFWSGVGLIVLSVVGLVMFILGLVADLKNRGIIESKEEQEPQQEEEPEAAEEESSQQTDVEQVLLPLVNAMLKDMEDQQQRRDGEPVSQNNNSVSRQADPERRDR